MEIELLEKWREHLRSLPESAMGSQHVDIFLNTGEVIVDVAVFNGRFAQLPHELDAGEEIVKIVPHEVKNDRKK